MSHFVPHKLAILFRMTPFHVRIHAPTLSELRLTKLALNPLYLEVHRVDMPVQHVHAAVWFCADAAVYRGFSCDLTGT